MSVRRPAFPWSDQQIIRALEFHPITEPVDEQIVRELAIFGASQILARREGGRRPKASSARGEIRRIVISGIFEGKDSFVNVLPARLRKTPSAPPTVRKVRGILADGMSDSAPDNRQLILSTEIRGSAVVLSVCDTGAGIPEADHDRIFDAFFTKKAEGMGLGLAISRAIVEAHGGKLRLVRSDSEGSEFEVAHPRAATRRKQGDAGQGA